MVARYIGKILDCVFLTFSEYKFRKRDSSFLLKTKGGKQFIEMDHWIDEATSSLLQDIAILQPLATTCIYEKLMMLEVKF